MRIGNDDVSIQDKVTSGKSVTAKYKRTEHALKTLPTHRDHPGSFRLFTGRGLYRYQRRITQVRRNIVHWPKCPGMCELETPHRRREGALPGS